MFLLLSSFKFPHLSMVEVRENRKNRNSEIDPRDVGTELKDGH